MQHHLQKLFTDIRKCRWQIARLSYVVVYCIQIVCHLRTVFVISRLITVCIDKSIDKSKVSACFSKQMFRCSFYLAVRKQADAHLVDGTGHKPHYSLRTLCRALRYVGSNPCKSVQRSLYEVGGQKRSVQERGFWVSFFSYILCVHTFGSIFCIF